MRIGFVTCVKLGLSCMQAIYEVGGTLDFAMTLHDDIALAKSGRVYLDEFCALHRIPLSKIRNINDPDSVSAIQAADLDWLFIVGWSQIARDAVLGATRCGTLGMHPTLLPVGRGRAAIPWAILLGLAETGVTLFRLDQGIDTGPILAQIRIPLRERETATQLYECVDLAHARILKENWERLVAGSLVPREQNDERATVWTGRRPEDGRLDPNMDVAVADRLIRAVTHPYPGAFLERTHGRVRIWASGAPGEDCGGSTNGPIRRLHFANGWLDATDWQAEPAMVKL